MTALLVLLMLLMLLMLLKLLLAIDMKFMSRRLLVLNQGSTVLLGI